MTEKMIENRVKKLQELEAQIKALEAAADEVREEIKADMSVRGLDELKTRHFVIRWKEVISSRIDSKALKAELPAVYGRFCKASSARRFTIVA